VVAAVVFGDCSGGATVASISVIVVVVCVVVVVVVVVVCVVVVDVRVVVDDEDVIVVVVVVVTVLVVVLVVVEVVVVVVVVVEVVVDVSFIDVAAVFVFAAWVGSMVEGSRQPSPVSKHEAFSRQSRSARLKTHIGSGRASHMLGPAKAQSELPWSNNIFVHHFCARHSRSHFDFGARKTW